MLRTTKTRQQWILMLAATATLIFSGCALRRSDSNASFVSNPPALESYQAAGPAAYGYQTAANGASRFSDGFPSAASNCGASGFS